MRKRLKHHAQHLLAHSHEYVVLAAPLLLERAALLLAGTSLLFVICVCIFADKNWDGADPQHGEDRDF